MTMQEWNREHASDDLMPRSGPYGEVCDYCGYPLEEGDAGFWVPDAGGNHVAVHKECLFEWVAAYMEPDTLAFAMGLESWRCQ